jgi:hypothetical protein
MVSQSLLAIERSIYSLSAQEKLWLLERIAHQLQGDAQTLSYPLGSKDMETALAEMANDPEIQAEIAAINTEYAIAEMDGLEGL